MKKTIRFSKFFPGAAVLSSVVIILGIVSLCTRGMNWGLEFKPGQNIQVAVLNSEVDTQKVSDALSAKDISAAVKSAGSENSFQIRTGEGEDAESKIRSALEEAFGGAENIVIEQSQAISAQFSSSLIKSSIILVLATLVLIFIYCLIRFKWDFALASVVAIVHDALIMISFLSFTQLEFTTSSIAAILTILGYSINDTVVILDRIRSDLKTTEAKSFTEVLNNALTGTLSRTIITSVTTLVCVISLVIFTTGDIRNFAIALIVGIVSGCYSTIYISSGILSLTRRNWKKIDTAPKAKVISMREED